MNYKQYVTRRNPELFIESTMGAWEADILSMASEYQFANYEDLSFQIAEKLPEQIAKTIKVDYDEMLSDQVFFMINYMVYKVTKGMYKNVSNAALRLDEEGY